MLEWLRCQAAVNPFSERDIDDARQNFLAQDALVKGSVAWSKALVTVNVLTVEEQQKLEDAWGVLLEEVQANPKAILASDAEDIHSWVETQLINKVGDLGKRRIRLPSFLTAAPGCRVSGSAAQPRRVSDTDCGYAF